MKTPKSWKTTGALAGTILLGTLATPPASAQDYPTLIQAQSPVDYWRLDETTPSPAINTVSNLGSTGAAGTGYVLNGALTGQPGIVGNSIRLFNLGQYTGQDTKMVDIPNLPALNPEPPFTIEFWTLPNTPLDPIAGTNSDGSLVPDTTGICVLESDSPDPSASSRSGYLFYVLSNSFTFRLGGEGGYAATATANVIVSTNSWTHVVGEFDGTTASIYINGVLKGTGAVNNSFHINQWHPTRIGGTVLQGDEGLFLGLYVFTWVNMSTGNRGYDGWVDEFAVYNSLLSPNTITAHYNAGTNKPSPATYDALILASKPVGYWNMDEPAFTPPTPSSYPFAADIGSLADNGTNTYGALADQPGVPGLSADSRSVFYSGELGSLALDTNNTEPAFAGTGQQITLGAWIKPTTLGVGLAGDIIAQGYDDNLWENYLRMADTFDWERGTGLPDVTYYDVGSGDAGYCYSAIFPVPPGDIGNWVFLAGTYDGTNWNLYRNGTLVGQTPDGGIGPNYVQASWSVGSRSVPDSYFGFFFPGSISEAFILTNALDTNTIMTLYNSVQRPPVITQAPQAPSPAYLGSSATFSVWADGPGTLSYQWVSNKVALTGQTGTNFTINGLTAAADATYAVIVTNLYGAVTSSVVLVVTPTLPPITLVPAAETRWLGSPLSFAPAIVPNQQLSYQWYLNSNAIAGATQESYTTTAAAGSIGSYTLVFSNSFAVATSAPATLSVLTPPAGYAATVVGDNPLSYFRLDETNGTTAYDYAGGNNGTYFGSYELGQSGALLFDPDFAVTFSGTTNSYVGGIGPTSINFPGTVAEFSIEAWANGAPGQVDGAAVIAKGTGDVGENYATEQFAIGVKSGYYRFYVNDDSGDTIAAIASTGPDGKWHHLVGVCNSTGGGLTFYIDGAVAATSTLLGLNADGILNSTDPVGIGAERSGILPVYDWDYNGTIDEVAIYAYALSAAQVQAHFAAAYGPNTKPFIITQPTSITNYANLPVTLAVEAAGTVPLNYQWNQVGVGPIAGATANSYTIPNLAFTDAGQYTVGISNLAGGILSTTVTVTVLLPPTNPPAIAGLVLHLTFDGNLLDATGRGNNATNEASGGAPLLTNNYVPGQIGEAFTYQTTVNSLTTNANYASLGVRPDLQFGTNSFTVSMWVQLPPNYVGNDLPFFTDVIGSTYGYPGFCFEPSFGETEGGTPGWPGAWGFSVFDNGSPAAGVGVYGDVGSINSGGWHNLIYVIDRTAGASVYLDGVLAHQNRQKGTTVAGIGNINSTYAATIGQDPTGLYPQPSDGNINIDDLGVWSRALTPLEAASIFTAGNINQLSFFGGVTLTPALLSGGHLQLTWSQGSLQSSSNLLGPWTTLGSATSPYTNNLTGSEQYFRVKY
jgi:hypothetical protein